ncbi:MAG: glycosyltransferase family 39 protein [Acetobacteraceae bacterium]|nr:glycosyltransferase family 39 protein [Acetobacteraceae bacterium]
MKTEAAYRLAPGWAAWSGLARQDDSRAVPGQIAFFLLAFVLLWTLYGSIADAPKALHGDVAEAYVWGREFQLGYNQHPPFWAWIAGLWFLIFPEQDWAFKLLAMLNAAAGLAGAWQLIGLFTRGWRQLAAFAMLLLTPFYTFLAFKYNANTIFLSLWPWTLYCFIQSMQRRRAADGIAFGGMVALCLLSKYYAIILVITCLTVSFLHQDWRRYYRSAAPYIAVATCAVLVMPHVVWAIMANAPPVEYVMGRSGIGWADTAWYAGEFIVSVTLYHALVPIVLTASHTGRRAPPEPLALPRRFVAGLVLLPVALTVLFGAVFELKISAAMAVGIFPVLPLLALELMPASNPRRAFQITAIGFGALTAGSLIASPMLAWASMKWGANDPSLREPRVELAEAVTQLWRETTGLPLRYAGGTAPYGNAVMFYSPDHPSGFIALSYHRAPWVTPDLIAQHGLAAVCLRSDAECLADAASLATPQTRRIALTLTHSFWGLQQPPANFDIFLIPPRP